MDLWVQMSEMGTYVCMRHAVSARTILIYRMRTLYQENTFSNVKILKRPKMNNFIMIEYKKMSDCNSKRTFY